MLPDAAQSWLNSVKHILESPETKEAIDAFAEFEASAWKPIPQELQGIFLSAAIDVFIIFRSDTFELAWQELKHIEKIETLIAEAKEGVGLVTHVDFETGWAAPIRDMMGRQKSKQAACVRCLISMLDNFRCDLSRLPVSAYQFALDVILDEQVEAPVIYNALKKYKNSKGELL